MGIEGGDIARRTFAGTATAAMGVALAPSVSSDPEVAALVAALTPQVLSPAVEWGLSSVGAALTRLTQRNTETIVNVAALESGKDREALLEEVLRDPHQFGLFTQAIRASLATNSADKLLLLGRSLAAAMNDPARVDEEAVFLARLERIEQYHVRLMRTLERNQDEESALIEVLGHRGNGQIDAFTRRQIVTRDGGLDHCFSDLAHDLETLGMIQKVNTRDSMIWDDRDVVNACQADLDFDGLVPMWGLTRAGRSLLSRARATVA